MAMERMNLQPRHVGCCLLIINIIWANVASNKASQQLNDRGFEFQEDRDVSLQAVFGSDSELPVTITSEFVHRDDPSRQANVSWRLIDASGNVVLIGSSTNEAASVDAELPPGEYTLNTTVEENIIAIQYLNIAPFTNCNGGPRTAFFTPGGTCLR